MKTMIAQTLGFGRDGDAGPFLAYGWSMPEDGFCWTDGKAAGMVMPLPYAPHGLFLELLLQVHGYPNGSGGQSLTLSVNGYDAGYVKAYGRSRLAWFVPIEVIAICDGRMVINLSLPDAVAPQDSSDRRLLGIAAHSLRVMPLVEPARISRHRIAANPVAENIGTARELAQRITGMTVADLALNFESLGVNCEGGFFQRECGVEPLSLLRFSGVILHHLVWSIDDGFSDLGNPNTIDPLPDEANLKDYIVYERRHMLRYHTWVLVSDATVDDIKKREVKRLPFLKSKLLEDFRDGEKLFVHQHNREISHQEILPLYLAIQRRGPGSLLCITPADDTHQAGLVEEILPGLMRGYFSHFSSAILGTSLSLPEWLGVCTNAWLLKNYTDYRREAV